MARVAGIDLGTARSAVAVLDGGTPAVVAGAEGSRTTPSVVAFAKNAGVLVGEVAKRQAVTNVDRTIRSVKRHMGTDWTVTVDGKKFTPQQVSAFILQKLKRDAEAYLGEKITDAVITVPAYFSDAQRQATREAGTIAGLNVLRVVSESVAAGMAYHRVHEEQAKILVFDLGAGSLSVSLLNAGDGVVEEEATSGDNHLGGDDWDQWIVDWLVQDFKAGYGIDLSKDKMALQRLRESAEKAKIELSQSTESQINLPYISQGPDGPLHLDTRLSRAEFQRMTCDLLDRCKGPFQQVIKDANVKVADIDHVVLVGGSTRMPAVVDLVKSLTGGKEPNKGVNPDEVVAVGACLEAGVLTGKVKDILSLRVTPLSLGVETKGGIFTKLIERNTTIPAKKSGIFTTADDGQAWVQVQVYQGEREIAADNKKLGMFDLTGIAPAPRGIPQIEVSFDIDANGIVNVSAKDLGTGSQQSLVLGGSPPAGPARAPSPGQGLIVPAFRDGDAPAGRPREASMPGTAVYPNAVLGHTEITSWTLHTRTRTTWYTPLQFPRPATGVTEYRVKCSHCGRVVRWRVLSAARTRTRRGSWAGIMLFCAAAAITGIKVADYQTTTGLYWSQPYLHQGVVLAAGAVIVFITACYKLVVEHGVRVREWLFHRAVRPLSGMEVVKLPANPSAQAAPPTTAS